MAASPNVAMCRQRVLGNHAVDFGDRCPAADEENVRREALGIDGDGDGRVGTQGVQPTCGPLHVDDQARRNSSRPCCSLHGWSMPYEELARRPVLRCHLGDSPRIEAGVGQKSKPVLATEQAEAMRLVHDLDRTVDIAK